MSTAVVTVTPLDFDPFQGDFGTPDDKLFSDKMVKGRGKYSCFHCLGGIAPGEQHRSRSERADGEFMSFRWCLKCCEAMVKQLQGEGLAYEERGHWQGRAKPC